VCQSFVSLANGDKTRTLREANTTITASSSSTRTTRPRPYLSQAVLVAGHPIADSELLSGRIHGQDIERTSGQEPPGRGAGRLH